MDHMDLGRGEHIEHEQTDHGLEHLSFYLVVVAQYWVFLRNSLEMHGSS